MALSDSEWRNTINTMTILLVICAVWLACELLRDESTKVKAPRIGAKLWLPWVTDARGDFTKNGRLLTKQGYERFKGSMYWIQTGETDRLVLSNRYLDEVRRLPDSYLDSRLAVVQRNLGWYNGVDIILQTTTHVEVCQTQLVQNLSRVTDSQISDLDAIFKTELYQCFQQTGLHFFNASERILNIVNRSVARMLVGDPLCKNDIWLKTSLEATVNTGMVCRDLMRYPRFLRPLVCRFLTSRRNLGANYANARTLLADVLSSHGGKEMDANILRWLIAAQGDHAKNNNIDILVNQLLFLATAATRSTAITVVNALFDLATRPGCQETIRIEINEALTASGGWNLLAIQRMKKLDSFLKESTRLNNHLLLSFNRKVRQPITLSTGVNIPAGTFISMPAYWAARDSEVYPPDGEDFQPWRWVERRDAAEKEGKSSVPYLSRTPDQYNLHWGYGRNACPGRFMADAEAQLILAWTLWHFNISWPQGQYERPESLFIDERVIPNPMQEIGFQLRGSL